MKLVSNRTLIAVNAHITKPEQAQINNPVRHLKILEKQKYSKFRTNIRKEIIMCWRKKPMKQRLKKKKKPIERISES